MRADDETPSKELNEVSPTTSGGSFRTIRHDHIQTATSKTDQIQRHEVEDAL
jgi:hypothetical protein